MTQDTTDRDYEIQQDAKAELAGSVLERLKDARGIILITFGFVALFVFFPGYRSVGMAGICGILGSEWALLHVRSILTCYTPRRASPSTAE